MGKTVTTISIATLTSVAWVLAPAASAAQATDAPSHVPDKSHTQTAPPGSVQPKPRPQPNDQPKDMITEPHESGKSENPDNMPIKRPDHKTNDAILHDRLPSDAIAK
jgi:hypothetical protein